MATFLIKTEPDDYSFRDMIRDKETEWDGVRNPAAQMHMRAMRKGDQAFFYHTGSDKHIAGLVRVVRGPYPDPAQPGLTKNGDPKGVLVDVAPIAEAKTTTTLAQIKADERFDEFALVKQSRLSVMPVPVSLDKALRKMSGLPN